MSLRVAASPFDPPARENGKNAVQRARAPWEWTIEERLSARLDPMSIAERQDAAEGRHPTIRSQSVREVREGIQNYSVDGAVNPELLLPHELFQSLLTGFVPDEQRQRRQRESLRRGIVAAGFDEELFWAQLRSAASEYIDSYLYPPPTRIESTSRQDRDGRCRAGFVALNTARQVFGANEFDRFLYDVVAPRTQVASTTSAADPAAELRYVELGCQQ
jgi:hypothetical protein